MIEIAAKDLLFYFNKKHLEDPTIPRWVVTCNGTSYYVNHVESQMPWSTRESDTSATKGSIKFKKALLTIDEENNATLSSLTLVDVARLKAKSFTRIMFTVTSNVKQFIIENNIHHTAFIEIGGTCGRRYILCDIKKSNDITLMKLSLPMFRILQENENYYKMYDDKKLRDMYDNDEVDDYDEDDEDNED